MTPLPPLKQLKHPGLKILVYLQVKNIVMDAGHVKPLRHGLSLHCIGPIHGG